MKCRKVQFFVFFFLITKEEHLLVNPLKCVNFERMYLVHKSVGFRGYIHHGNGFEASAYWTNPLGFSLNELRSALDHYKCDSYNNIYPMPLPPKSMDGFYMLFLNVIVKIFPFTIILYSECASKYLSFY
jgi:hypothetical protein